jgi:ABC-type Na+ transport system ATPase subunit NatA
LYGLVGPDGAGKTTSIRILATVITPSDGTAHIAGYDVVRQSELARRHIGCMPQSFSLYPDLAVQFYLNHADPSNSASTQLGVEMISQMALPLTSLAIVREREQGTMEQLIITPIRPWGLWPRHGTITPATVWTCCRPGSNRCR